MLYLKQANYEDIEKEYLFVKDMPVDENGLTNQWHGISREEFEKDDEIVGQFRIRHYLCKSLREGAGHIGYFVHKNHRGKGYGTEGLRLTLEVARTIIPEDEFYLRVNRDNPASLKSDA